MLRTYDDIGSRQEQRFHLELGVMKLVHAQRLLPLEQVLSQAGVEAVKPGILSRAASPGATVAPTSIPARKPEGGASPFEADRTRKTHSSRPESLDTPRVQIQTVATVTALAIKGARPPHQDDAARLIRTMR